MRPTKHDQPQGNVDQRMRTMLTLWGAMLASVGVYYAFSLFQGRPGGLDPESTLPLPWIAVALSTILISFPLKSKLLNRAVDEQQVQQVQQAYIVAWAITETSALLGLLLFFFNGNRFYYIPFLIAAAGLLLHFPRREHLVNASFRNPVT